MWRALIRSTFLELIASFGLFMLAQNHLECRAA
jgi:hypothetical protein